jgi:hypothetical protein
MPLALSAPTVRRKRHESVMKASQTVERGTALLPQANMRGRKDALTPVRLHRAHSLPIPWASRGIGSHPPDLLVGAQGVFAQAARSGHWLNGEGAFWCSSRHLIWHVPSRKDARALSHQEVFKTFWVCLVKSTKS